MLPGRELRRGVERVVWFGLLGPVAVGDGVGQPVVLPAGIPRNLLTLLLLNANRVVAAEQLAQAVWGQDLPVAAAAGLRGHVLRLRRQLGEAAGGRIVTAAPGYLVEVGPGELDEQVFADGCRSGRQVLQAGDFAAASEVLGAALALWRGEPLAEMPASAQVEDRAQWLRETRLLAWEGRIEADLHLGRHAELVAELRTLTGAHPLREAVHGQLMLALYRSGRQAESLEAFAALRRTLVHDLGVEPSGDLQQLHTRILHADPALLAPAAAAQGEDQGAGPTVADRHGPRFQLPTDTRTFTGRTREVERLLALALQTPAGGGAGTVVVSAIDGMGGIGKSALAVHAAHQLRDRYPDGQLFLDLQGHTPGTEPLTAGEALEWFLRSLGVSAQAIPRGLGERAAFYRDRLADTRTLIVLDNAGSTAQVRPLLPAAPGCLVLITSRKRLIGLDDAHTLALDVLPRAEAEALLLKVAGPGRLPHDHPAIAELAALCENLPLAIRIIAARLRRRRTLLPQDLVAQLRDERTRLERLRDEDRSLAAVFASSRGALPAAERELFRLLALTPGADFDAHAVANLAGTGHREAEDLLESLLDHNLLTQRTAGRYRFHDLVRLYARGLGEHDGPDAEQDHRAALDRLLDYYQHTADTADLHFARQTRPAVAPAAGAPVAVAPALPDRADAREWMRTERDNLIAAVAHATAHDRTRRALALTTALAAFLQDEGPWPEAADLLRTATGAASDLGERPAEANVLVELGRIHYLSGDYATAGEVFEQALTLYQGLGERLGEGNALAELGRIHWIAGDYAAADEMFERALTLYQDLGEPLGEGNALADQGRVRMVTGDYAASVELFEHALVLHRELGASLGEANTLADLGRVRCVLGEYLVAGELFERALALFQELGHRRSEAFTHTDLGRVRLVTGDCAAAGELFERAQAVYRDLGHRHGQANSLWDLGRVRMVTGDYTAAAELQQQALVIFQDIGHRHGEALVSADLGRTRLATGDHTAAAELQQQALVIFQELGDRLSEANILHNLGRVRHAAGDLPAATDLLQQALARFRDLGDPQGEAEVLNSTGALLARTAGPGEALPAYQQALDLARKIHSPLDEARALEGVGRCAAGLDDRTAAVEALEQALALYRRSGAAETESASAFLAAVAAGG